MSFSESFIASCNMLLLYILILWEVEAVPKYQLNMYNTNNHHDGHCLSYHLRTIAAYYINGHDENVKVDQIISYCYRPAEENDTKVLVGFQNNTDPNFTFAELRQKNITSQMLLSWSASIDMAEQYQIFLNNYSNSSSEKGITFYNCTSSWFGPLCQFRFDSFIDMSLNDMFLFVFRSTTAVTEGVKVTCYKHLRNCETLLSCLDWREICDGKNDCFDGSDEEHCWQLEVNECNENEYRCHNGQCIPIEFFRDIKEDSDCLDRTDEEPYEDFSCYYERDFKCEEHSCRPGKSEFPCGDGQCIHENSKCSNGRHSFLPSTFCSNATACSMELFSQVDLEWCETYCLENACIKNNCSMVYDFRAFPLLFRHVRLMISGKNVDSDGIALPDYVCYDIKLCPHFPIATEHFNNLSCRYFNEFGFSNINLNHSLNTLIDRIKNEFRGCLITINKTHYCNYSTMYQCQDSSKCISKYRLLDGFPDCPFNDDETYNESCLLDDTRQRFKCNDEEKCFAQLVILNGKTECKYGEDEYNKEEAFVRTHISFQTICDRFTDLLPVLIDGKKETDETNCEHWQCNNTYSICDDIWLCENGADEINCAYSNCTENHHECVLRNDTSKVACLPISRAGDDYDDCLGGTDERTKHNISMHHYDAGAVSYQFHCWNDTELISMYNLCDKKRDCFFSNDDEAFCTRFLSPQACSIPEESQTDVEKFFCALSNYREQKRQVYFKIHDILGYPLGLVIDNTLIEPSDGLKTRSIENYLTNYVTLWCNRGIPLRLRINNNTSTSCLCPPSYYGDKCQYQNQRVSLTIQIRVSSDWRTIFIFLITLIDNDRNIESHDHIEYLPVRDCKTKYNIYLLYSTRPKNSSKTYSVQIDAFDQKTMNYRASWIFPLHFPFLPVNRLAVLLKFPFPNMIFVERQCSPPCIHGQCFHYVNDKNLRFCRCEHGWSGVQCDAEHKCDCALGALCISDAVCLCPPDRFGPRCHLFQSSCDSESCLNGGRCVSGDVRHTGRQILKLLCICPEGYIGGYCKYQQKRTRIDITFHSNVIIPSLLFVHFIGVRYVNEKDPNRTTIAKKVPFDQNSVILYTPSWFNIALAQIFDQYYLIILHRQTIIAAHIHTKIIPSHRCRSIVEVFNETFAKIHLLKRIKYYHLPCQQQSDLVCFYDDVHICLCTLTQTTNCFEFNHNMTYDCNGYNHCENKGHCFHDNLICPTSSLCACDQCYFGSRCQLSTKGSSLSLDIILGHHMVLKTGISQQNIIVKISVTLTTIIFVLGFINSFLTFQTFRGKQTRNVGCGFYLFTSSIVSMLIVIVLSLKCAFFMASQIGSINNRSFILVQCRSMDFLLRCLLSINDWLNACVAVERAINVIQGVKFNKEKSKRVAKWVITTVFLFTSCTYIYDPIYRRLIDDEEEQRTWCVTQYSLFVQRFDRFLNIFHFSIPFAINSISALIIIIVAARMRSNAQKTKPLKEHLREQFHHHKHLLISPLILIALAIPRLIISFLSGCMKSARDSWFYLIGYYISFIPSIMTLIVFVLPSDIYKKEFSSYIKRTWQR